MRITVSKNYEELCKLVADFINENIRKLKSPLLCFAGGDTPLGVFNSLISLVKKGDIIFNQTNFIGLDEWLGLNASDPGSCRYTLEKNLYQPLNIQKSRIHFFDGKADNPLKQCAETNKFLETNGPIDLILLGIGMNGHIGFNEPGSDLNSICRIVSLDKSTQKIGQKYFDTPRLLNQGITLGLKQILETRTAVLIASGQKKKHVVKALIENNNINLTFPVSSLWQHSDCHLFIDEAAYL